jgi:hypothetical protein
LQESDRGVVPVKLPNKEEPSSTEVVEGRQRPKENDAQSNTSSPTQSGERVSQGLSGVRRTAQERKKERTIPNNMPTVAPRFRISPLG